MDNTRRVVESADPRVKLAMAEYLERVDRGEQVDRDQFLAAHADIAHELRSFIATSEELARLAAPAEPDAGISTNSLARRDQETMIPQRVQGAPSDPGAAGVRVTDLPEQFGRYRILKPLGSGAMGTVYLAEDTQLQRKVALKTPTFEQDDTGELLERFYREARSAATLRQPNICPVHDVGEIDGKHYITMAYIEGRPLSAYIRPDKPQSERQVLMIVRKLALALQEAHDHNIIHRDLKPGNIMIDGRGEPIVMDFGLARKVHREDASRITQSGMIVGSPAYMSPEQVEGEPDKLGPAADQYSLGVILYELLTAQLPFRGSVTAVIGAILTKEPAPVEELRAGVDPRIAALCRRMMAKQARDRFPSMKAVADEVSQILKQLANAKSDSDAPSVRGAGAAAKPQAVAKGASTSAAAITASNVASLYEAAQKCMRKRDYEQVVQMLETLPEDKRSDDVIRLLAKARQLSDEVQFLLAEIDEALRVNDNETLGKKADELLKLKPGHRKAKQIKEELSRYGGGFLRRRGQGRGDDRRVGEGSWVPWAAIAFGLLVFGMTLWGVTIYLRSGSAVVRVDINDPELKVSVQDKTITIEDDGQEIRLDPQEGNVLEITYGGATFRTENTFNLIKGDNPAVSVTILDETLAARFGETVLGEWPVEQRAVSETTGDETVPQTSPVATTASVPADAVGFQGHSYKYFGEVLSWKEAKQRCEALGGHLPIVETAAENAFLTELAERSFAAPLTGKESIWIGVSDEAQEGAWRWIDAAQSPASGSITYTNWASNQPNNKNQQEHFATLKLTNNAAGTWTDQPNVALANEQTVHWICEWDELPIATAATTQAPNAAAPQTTQSLPHNEWIPLDPTAPRTTSWNWGQPLRNPENKMWENGVLSLDNAAVAFNQIQAKDVSFRATVQFLEGNNMALVVRGEHGKGGVYALFDKQPNGKVYVAFLNTNSSSVVDVPNGYFDFQVDAVGEQVTIQVNGQTVVRHRERQKLNVGHIEVTAFNARGMFKDMAVKILDEPPATAAAQGGWTDLFNGRNLTGWTVMRATSVNEYTLAGSNSGWEVRNGELICSDPNGSVLRSDRQYGDFVFQMDYKLPANMNTAVYAHVPESGLPWRTGLNCQLIDNNMTGRSRPIPPQNRNGSLVGVVAPDRNVPCPVDEWNSFELRCEGDRVQISLNGTLALETTTTAHAPLVDVPRSGYLCLSNVRALATGTAYRNIRIRELDTTSSTAQVPEPTAGWTDLFNGRDLSGWTAPVLPNNWEVRDGVIVGKGTGLSALFANGTYGDFELDLEYKLTAGSNSGIWFRAPNNTEAAFGGAKTAMSISLVDATSPVWAKDIQGNPSKLSGGLHAAAGPDPIPSAPVGVWHHLVLRAVGSRVTLMFNGTQVLDVNTADHVARLPEHTGLTRTSGYIGLEDHGDDGVEFRNIRIRPIGSADKVDDVAAALQGAWTAVAQEIAGGVWTQEQITEHEKSITFADDTFEIRYRDRSGQFQVERGTYRLDPSHNPPHITMNGTTRDGRAIEFVGIYQLQGDQLRHCFVKTSDNPTATRPTGFSTSAGSGRFSTTYRRIRELDATGATSASSAGTPELVSLSELNTDEQESVAWVSRDGLRIYWEGPPPAGQEGQWIWTADRPAGSARFENKRALLAGHHPVLTSDELEIVFTRPVGMGRFETLSATRPSTSDPFGPPESLPHFGAAASLNIPWLSADGLTLYVTSVVSGDWPQYLLARRVSRTDDWGAPETLDVRWDRLQPGPAPQWISLSDDALSLLGTREGDVGQFRVVRSMRTAVSEPFSEWEYVSLPGIGQVHGRTPRYSPQTRELYLWAPPDYSQASQRGAGWQAPSDLWVIRNVDLPWGAGGS